MFLSYSWTLFVSFWKLPSWLFFLQIGELLAIYSYAFLLNFIESLLLVFVVLVLGLVLPRHWWLDAFISKGFVVILVILASALLHVSLYPTPDTRPLFIHGQLEWWLGTGLVCVLLAWAVGRVASIRRGLESVAERFLVFLYVYLPITAFALLIVIVRILV